MMAMTYLLDIAQKKGDKNAIADMSEKVCDLDLMNIPNCKAAIEAEVVAGRDDQASARLTKMLESNPVDADLLRTQALLQLRQSKWKQAIATGKALIAADTTAANADFMNRMIGAAQKDSNSAAIVDFATMAEKKFPKDISYPQLIAQTQRKLGRLPEASAAIKRALVIEPKNTDAVVIAVNIARDMNQSDSAITIAKRGIDAGADKTVLEPVIIGPVGALVSKAQTSKERADWEAALAAAQPLDKTSPSTTTKFFVGFAAFSVGLDALTNARKLNDEKGKGAKEAKVKACAEAKVAEDMWATAQVAIVAGAKYSAEGAGQMMTAMQQYGDMIPELKKSTCGGK
jgi:tetratricopeptide (TPR) repeat protein